MSENKEFLANFIADFQSKNQQKFVEMRSESPELLSAIENVLGFLKGKYELDTDIELVPESAIPKPVVEPTAPIEESKIRVGVISLKIVSNDGQTETFDSSYWTNSQNWLNFWIDKFGINNLYTIDVDILWKNQFIFQMSVTIDDWFREIRYGLGKWVETLLLNGFIINSQLTNQAFKNYNELAFEDDLQPTTNFQPTTQSVTKINVHNIYFKVDVGFSTQYIESFKSWTDAQKFIKETIDLVGIKNVKQILLNIIWKNQFEFEWVLSTKSYIRDIRNDLSEFVETLVTDGMNFLDNQTFKDYQKLSFADANVSQTQNVTTSKPQPTLVNIPPTGNEIELKSFVFTLEDSQKGLIEADGVLWSELNDIFLKSFERNTFQKLTMDVEWEDGFLIVETIYFDDIDAVEMLENTTSIGTFIYKNWDLFTTTQAKSRGNYAFSDSLATKTASVTSKSSLSGIVKLESIEMYLHTKTSILPYEYKNFDVAAREISSILENTTLLDVERVRLNIFWEDGSDIQFQFHKKDNGFANLKANSQTNPTALLNYTIVTFKTRFPAIDISNYEGLGISGQSSSTITIPPPPTPPAKRGRPKKVTTASQSSTATTSTPKVKKKIDDVKTADDLLDLDLDDLEI